MNRRSLAVALECPWCVPPCARKWPDPRVCSGRAFTRLYLRRILALAVIGALHFIYVWDGDILFSYAIGALALLIVMYGRALPILIACAVLTGLGFLPGADPLFRVAGGLAAAG